MFLIDKFTWWLDGTLPDWPAAPGAELPAAVCPPVAPPVPTKEEDEPPPDDDVLEAPPEPTPVPE